MWHINYQACLSKMTKKIKIKNNKHESFDYHSLT